jgi:hypothetical protein
MGNLKNGLEDDYGLNLAGWRLDYANGISADGSTIVGSGTNPAGRTEGWVAVVPEPASLYVLAGGFALLRGRMATRARPN